MNRLRIDGLALAASRASWDASLQTVDIVFDPYEYMDMDLTKKTTILLSPDLHRRLTRIAGQRGTSLGDLVRTACERQYGGSSPDEKLAAVRRLSQLHLPVSSVRRMKRESVPDPESLAP